MVEIPYEGPRFGGAKSCYRCKRKDEHIAQLQAELNRAVIVIAENWTGELTELKEALDAIKEAE